MPHNKLRVVLQKAFSSEKLRLPKEQLDESSLPFPIASNISLQQYNSFVESEEISGYKLDYKKGTVYIVEMASTEHEAVIEIVRDAFRELCPRSTYGSLNNAPIQVFGQPYHDAPDGSHKAPDLVVRPHTTFVPDPPVPHPGPPPSDRKGNPYARIILEVAVSQSYSDLKENCRLWRQQPYLRSVLGIKLYDTLAIRNATTGRRERAMKATLWRQGFAKQKWHFGTVDRNGNQFPLGTNVCNAANDPNFIINIPVADIFYDPPIPAIGYIPLARPPPALYNAVVSIDLHEVQQAVLINQAK